MLCSDEAKERHFARYEHGGLEGKRALRSAEKGGVVGALLGGLAVAAGLVTSGGLEVLVAGAALLTGMGSGAIAGGFLGAMAARGVDPEMADHYEQAIEAGKILVVAHAGDEAAAARAERAIRPA